MDGERFNGVCIKKKERKKPGAWPVRQPQLVIGRLTVSVFNQNPSFPTSTQFIPPPPLFFPANLSPTMSELHTVRALPHPVPPHPPHNLKSGQNTGAATCCCPPPQRVRDNEARSCQMLPQCQVRRSSYLRRVKGAPLLLRSSSWVTRLPG